MEYMVPPIWLCTNGHNICSKCREKVQFCPTCRANFSEIRNLTLENIARRQMYPCANRKSGCLEFLSIEHIADHHAVCVQGTIKCPFKTIGKCSWEGITSGLKKHAKAAHAKYFFEGSLANFPDIAETGFNLAFLSCFGNLFTYYQHTSDERLYGTVQLIGTIIEASRYKSKFTFLAENGSEKISNTFLVRSHTEDFEAIFQSGRCLILELATAINFLIDNKFNLKLHLSRV
jgi:E3 ubiquitin-protein ligase SIAH1